MEQPNQNYINSGQQPTYTPTSDERTMAILAHILAFVSSILGPLIIYLLKKDESQYVAEQAKESLNFQISVAILYIACFILMFIIIGIPMMVALTIFNFIVVIIATVKASDNKIYRYPLNFRLIK